LSKTPDVALLDLARDEQAIRKSRIRPRGLAEVQLRGSSRSARGFPRLSMTS
jgi:hypothetical protein